MRSIQADNASRRFYRYPRGRHAVVRRAARLTALAAAYSDRGDHVAALMASLTSDAIRRHWLTLGRRIRKSDMTTLQMRA